MKANWQPDKIVQSGVGSAKQSWVCKNCLPVGRKTLRLNEDRPEDCTNCSSKDE